MKSKDPHKTDFHCTWPKNKWQCWIHTYRNLDAYVSNRSAINHFIQVNAPKHIVTDSILIPTGEISSVTGTPLDFNKPKQIRSDLSLTEGLCGIGCIGYASLSFLFPPPPPRLWWWCLKCRWNWPFDFPGFFFVD